MLHGCLYVYDYVLLLLCPVSVLRFKVPTVVIFSATHWFLALVAVWRKAYQTQNKGHFLVHWTAFLEAFTTVNFLFQAFFLQPDLSLEMMKVALFPMIYCIRENVAKRLSLKVTLCFFSALLLSFVILLFSLRIFLWRPWFFQTYKNSSPLSW